jgi:hypothetical protein
MDDPDIRERLIAYVSAEPPRTLTADAVVRAGRRARRLSRLRATSAAVILTATAAVVPAVLGAGGGSDPTGTDPAVETACVATAEPPRAVRDGDGFPPYDETSAADAETDALIDRRAALLRCVVTELVTSRLPGFRFHQVGDADTPPARTLAPFEFYVDVEHQRFESTAVAVDDQGAVAVGFTVTRASDVQHDSDGQAIDPACPSPPCQHTTAPGGRNITYQASDLSLHVTVDFGQTIVQAWMFAQDLRHWHTQPTAPPRAGLPLTIEQLIEIASDPRLDVFAQP